MAEIQPQNHQNVHTMHFWQKAPGINGLILFLCEQQVQNLTALVGKAFQVAFAESKFPKGTEVTLEQFKTEASDKQIVQGRRWVCIK